MADVVEDSETHTNRRSEGLFLRLTCCHSSRHRELCTTGVIVSAVGFDSITNVADFTDEHRFTNRVFLTHLLHGLSERYWPYSDVSYWSRKPQANLQIIKERNSALR